MRQTQQSLLFASEENELINTMNIIPKPGFVVRLFCLLLMLWNTAFAAYGESETFGKERDAFLAEVLTGKYWRSDDSVKVISFVRNGENVKVEFTLVAATTLVTSQKLRQMSDSVRAWTGAKGAISFVAGRKYLSSLVPQQGVQSKSADERPLVTREGAVNFNLYGKNIALWNSHGLYYERSLERWEWQRARLFTTVEDLLTSGFGLEFLTPMFENAGANVFIPRERDTQRRLYVVDDSDAEHFSSTRTTVTTVAGYAHAEEIRDGENPFASGTAGIYEFAEDDSLVYTFENVDEGRYGVHICFEGDASCTDRATYSVEHRYGTTNYVVNQQRGGGMWVYLGEHEFAGTVRIVVRGVGRLSADAVRLGGGMGQVVRGGTTSGVARWMECARYYLQSDGFEAESVYSLSKGVNDYTDDVNCRGEWVNALKKKNINVDLALALHTDAGIAGGDSTIGTLAIVKSGNFSNGESRQVSRDIAFALEQQIADDMRQTWDSTWTLRGIQDKGYSEARRADCANVLLEMLSHQNLTDVRLALHPAFRFDMSRAIYKAVLRSFCGQCAVVQPLPVSSPGIVRYSPDSLQLSWQPTVDRLEPTAMPTHYEVYANGILVVQTESTSCLVSQKRNGEVVEYTIVAVNQGGRSFPSKGLCAALHESESPSLLFVDGFDRLSAPDIVSSDGYAGIDAVGDRGVAFREEYVRCGAQHDFDPSHPWIDDDNPGWGASFADEEGRAVRGSHASRRQRVEELAARGFDVVSQSKSFFEIASDTTNYSQYHISLGAQRTTWYGHQEVRHGIYSTAFMDRMRSVCSSGAEVYLSGFYVGSDLLTEAARQFAADVLGFRLMSTKASKTCVVVGENQRIRLFDEVKLALPDAIVPANKKARTVMRYEDSRMSAAVVFGNVHVCAFDN